MKNDGHGQNAVNNMIKSAAGIVSIKNVIKM